MNSCEAVAMYWIIMAFITKQIWMVIVGGLALGTGWMLGEWAEERRNHDTERGETPQR